MQKAHVNGLTLWEFENLGKVPLIKHFVTGRRSHSQENEFTLSISSSPNKELIYKNRSLLAEAMGIQHHQLYFPVQVHQTKIATVSQQTSQEDLIETDALITNEKGICLAVMSADCVTILLYDTQNHAIGAVHAGWKGTVAKILEKTLQEMNQRFGTTGNALLAGIGPSVCQESYEVGEEVIHAVNNSFGEENGLMTLQPNHKAKLDLWRANKLQLLDFGVKESNIEVSNLCTVKNNHDFFSARKGDAGRFAAGIMLV